jgi:HD-GYP domain-containing protein (c-di-GMP phosphodiesterase class II)
MVKKIKAEQLEPGMFIHNLDCGWLNHPFLTNSLQIKDQALIAKILGYGIHEVYIDTDKGMDISGAITEEEVKRETQHELRSAVDSEPEMHSKVSIKEELNRAKEIKKDAKKMIQHIMNDIRFGKNIEKDRVEEVVDRMVGSIFRNQDALLSLGKIKNSDEYTFTHSVSVCALMLAFGRYLGYDAKLLREVGIGAMLHDIGKVKVPMALLNKEGALSDDEIRQVREHVTYSRVMLEETPGIADTSILVAAQHHERIDGRGYPAGLKNDEISEYGQAAAIIDVYDAMTSHRCYKRRVPPTEVLRKLFEWSRFYFNAELVQKFVRCIGIYPIGSLVYLESGLIAVVINHGVTNLLYPVIRVIFDSKRQSYIKPYDIDLASQVAGENEEKLVSYACQDHWNLDSRNYF